ncbi:hypothetical protein SAMN05444365_101464 [Micromonospora pattaloongensis]|uniref:Uncharacterized protein n=2 Tax=Micromonospora pattaloongensis TaxID=405436 RepID=A0A1H3GNI1_9ACTN|nr:hypothetical protein SAMN05444365_101464 [Micromonospora pattaloongensis]
MGAEVAIQSAFAKENVQLELLLRRLTDPAIGPMWWMQRYADIQFAVGDPKPKVKSMLEAFAELRRALEVAKVDKIDDLRLQARHKLDEVFAAIEDPQSFTLVIELMNRFLDEMGVQKSK